MFVLTLPSWLELRLVVLSFRPTMARVATGCAKLPTHSKRWFEAAGGVTAEKVPPPSTRAEAS